MFSCRFIEELDGLSFFVRSIPESEYPPVARMNTKFQGCCMPFFPFGSILTTIISLKDLKKQVDKLISGCLQSCNYSPKG